MTKRMQPLEASAELDMIAFRESLGYSPETCCACRWVAWGEECGHPESDGITSPHTHCPKHGAEPAAGEREP